MIISRQLGILKSTGNMNPHVVVSALVTRFPTDCATSGVSGVHAINHSLLAVGRGAGVSHRDQTLKFARIIFELFNVRVLFSSD